MINFDSINFQWETNDGQKRLVILVNDIDNWPQEQKEYFERQLTTAIKNILKAGA